MWYTWDNLPNMSSQQFFENVDVSSVPKEVYLWNLVRKVKCFWLVVSGTKVTSDTWHWFFPFQSMWSPSLQALCWPASKEWRKKLPYVQTAQARLLPQHLCRGIAGECKGDLQGLQPRTGAEWSWDPRHLRLRGDRSTMQAVPSFNKAKGQHSPPWKLPKEQDNLPMLA